MDALTGSLPVVVTISGRPTGSTTTSITARVTPPSSPLNLTYTTTSPTCNTSASVTRTVTVVDPCTTATTPNERTCEANGKCSFNGACGAAATALSSLQWSASAGQVAEAMWLPSTPQSVALTLPPETLPPVITLLGYGQMMVTDTGVQVMSTSVEVGVTYSDPGVTATKPLLSSPDQPLNLTSAVVITGVDVIDTSRPTPPARPFVVTYSLTDPLQPAAKPVVVRRRVHVVCPANETVCTPSADDAGLTCSYGGVCGLSQDALQLLTNVVVFSLGSMSVASAAGAGGNISSASSAAVASSGISAASASSAGFQTAVATGSSVSEQSPRLALLGPPVVFVASGLPYARCVGSSTSACEAGVVALAGDGRGRDITSHVYACLDKVEAGLGWGNDSVAAVPDCSRSCW